MSALTIPEIEAAIDTIVAHRNAILRGKSPYNPGDIRKIEDDLRDLRRIWSEIGSDESIKAVKRELDRDMSSTYKGSLLGARAAENGQNKVTHLPDWLREHEKIT